MSLVTQISDLTTRIATEFKAVKSKISGNVSGDLTGLSTTAKSSLLAAVNEIFADLAGVKNSKGQPNGIATLGGDGKVPSAQLPGFVDDIIEAADYASLPASGESGVLYVTIDTNKTYRWSGSGYVEVSESLALGETSATAYRGDRGKTAYDHSQATGNPHGTTFAQIASKPTTIAGFGITDAYTKTEIGDVSSNFVTTFEGAL